MAILQRRPLLIGRHALVISYQFSVLSMQAQTDIELGLFYFGP